MNISLVFTLNGVEHTIGPTIINSLLITLFLCIVCLVVGNKVKKADFYNLRHVFFCIIHRWPFRPFFSWYLQNYHHFQSDSFVLSAYM